VKNVTNERVRQALLQQLRAAVDLQLAIWNASSLIQDMLKCERAALDPQITFENASSLILAMLKCERDVTTRLMKVGTHFEPGTKLSTSDLSIFLDGSEGTDDQQLNFDPALPKGFRRNLLNQLQGALETIHQFHEVTATISETIDAPVSDVVSRVGEFSVTASSGMALTDLDLKAFLAEPQSVGHRRVGLPFRTTLLLTSAQFKGLREELAELKRQAANALEPVATQLVRVTEDGEIQHTEDAFSALEESVWRWLFDCQATAAGPYLERLGFNPDITKPENKEIRNQLMEAWAGLAEDVTRTALLKAADRHYSKMKATGSRANVLEFVPCSPVTH
jgi:hypothetical protein